jgi:hypothetical protein
LAVVAVVAVVELPLGVGIMRVLLVAVVVKVVE